MRDGHAVVRVADEPVQHLRPGDIAIFPRGAAHVVAENENASPQFIDQLLPDRQPGGLDVLDLGTGEQLGRMLCAGLDYEASGEYPLYRTLPELLIARAEEVESDRTLVGILATLVTELDDRRSSTQAVALRLFELIYILGLRCALATMSEPAPISRALANPAIAKVLITMYEDYAQRWSITELAALANMSRASFAATFKDIIGEPPARHLRRRRLARARELIETTNLSQNAIARKVGYESSVGLHLAFRAEYETTPGALRR
jgi:AraC-like DNA-binding protein